MTRRQIPPFGFRMRPEIKEEVQQEAQKNRHSINTELEMLVEEALACRRKRKARA